MFGVWVFESQNANLARKKIHYQINRESHILTIFEFFFSRKGLICASVLVKVNILNDFHGVFIISVTYFQDCCTIYGLTHS